MLLSVLQKELLLLAFIITTALLLKFKASGLGKLSCLPFPSLPKSPFPQVNKSPSEDKARQ